jgi:drug/metabolite transporter (DMT)-like permease
VILGAIIFAEAPSGLQIVGVAALLSGLVAVARTRAPPAAAG